MENKKNTKTCPYCAEEIKIAAIKCKHCHSNLETKKLEEPLIPIIKSKNQLKDLATKYLGEIAGTILAVDGIFQIISGEILFGLTLIIIGIFCVPTAFFSRWPKFYQYYKILTRDTKIIIGVVLFIATVPIPNNSQPIITTPTAIQQSTQK